MTEKVHDQALLDRLNAYPAERFSGDVFRATRIGADATAPSTYGGRWAPPVDGERSISVLYTSLERDGAMAEVVSFLTALTPIPGARPIKVTRLGVSTARTLKFARVDLETVGIDMEKYGVRDYRRTQEIGAALAFLNIDGLIAPSARWACDNLMIFADNHALNERLEILASHEIEWRSWAQNNGFIAAQ